MEGMRVTESGCYEYQFLMPVPDDLLCFNCKRVPQNPQQLDCCGLMICEDCLKIRGDTCPECTGIIKYFRDKRGSKNISKLPIKCSNTIRGCEWTGELGRLDEHLDMNCHYVLTECTDCGKKEIFRKDEQKHLQEECPKRLVDCELCNVQIQYCENENHKTQACPEVMLQCANEGCKQKIKRCNKDAHQDNECDHTILQCQYAEYGCERKVKRKDLLDHETDTRFHLEVVFKKTNNLVQAVEKLDQSSQIKHARQLGAIMNIDEKLGTIAQHLRENTTWVFKRLSAVLVSSLEYRPQHPQVLVTTFKIKDFESHKQNKTAFCSPPFYTSPSGYKMMVPIQPSDTDLLINVNVVPGENDVNLKWPITGAQIEVEILNQEFDVNHLSTCICCNALEGRFDVRPVYTSIGEEEMIPIADLTDRYTRNDMLYFRVTVHGEFETKGWLVCTA